MVSFVSAILLLILGYLCYGTIVEKVFGVDSERKTPCFTQTDGVDYIPMPTWRVFLVQFLNIAGTGPIFGAILGILFGPSAYLWIVFGCIFGGAVHDYMSAMISVRRGGASIPEIVGDELGHTARIMIRVLSLFLMVLVGTVFVVTPAGLLSTMVGGDGLMGQKLLWVVIIFAYYILATLLPIDKLIGRIYPIFGLALLIMAFGVGYGILFESGILPEVTDAFTSHHPTSTIPIFPGICITIACGAVSGFHATQSPMMARCIQNEKYGRPIFYGAMITEGIVALIWAAATIKFASSFDVTQFGMSNDVTPYEKLWAIMTNGGQTSANPAVLVNSVCKSWLGTVGAILAVLGVVAAPVTSGDTCFRSARLIAADFMHYKQHKIYRRLLLSLPIFMLSCVLMCLNFDVLWRYFAWFNQTLATIVLWSIAVWLSRQKKCYWIALVPATWMTLVCSTYIFIAPEGFQLSHTLSYIIGAIVTLTTLALFKVRRF